MLQGMVIPLKPGQQEPLLGINLPFSHQALTHLLVLDVLSQIMQLLCVPPEKRETNSPKEQKGDVDCAREYKLNLPPPHSAPQVWLGSVTTDRPFAQLLF